MITWTDRLNLHLLLKLKWKKSVSKTRDKVESGSDGVIVVESELPIFFLIKNRFFSFVNKNRARNVPGDHKLNVEQDTTRVLIFVEI